MHAPTCAIDLPRVAVVLRCRRCLLLPGFKQPAKTVGGLLRQGQFLLQRAMMELNLEHEQESRFVCGVSTPFEGLEQTGSALRQAQFCVPEGEER